MSLPSLTGIITAVWHRGTYCSPFLFFASHWDNEHHRRLGHIRPEIILSSFRAGLAACIDRRARLTGLLSLESVK